MQTESNTGAAEMLNKQHWINSIKY